jgi:hypothetical protein
MEGRVAWIRTVSPAEASTELLEVYNRMRDPAGKVANILGVHSLNPAALRTHFDGAFNRSMQHHLRNDLFKDGVYERREPIETFSHTENGYLEPLEVRAVVA